MTQEPREIDTQTDMLVALYAEADRAYRAAREAVFDELPPGSRLDLELLTDQQQAILIDLREAETSLDLYRRSFAGDPHDQV